jgi:hypothetical protein
MAAMTAEAVGAQHRAAVVCVDHVAKHTNRGRFALGGQHKMAGLSRAARSHLVETAATVVFGDRDAVLACRLREGGASYRAVAAAIGVSEGSVRNALKPAGANVDKDELCAPTGSDDPLPQEQEQEQEQEVEVGPEPEVGAGAEDDCPATACAVMAAPPVGVPVLADPVPRGAERVLARFGLIASAPPVFTPCARVPPAGLGLALPALAATGLLQTAHATYGGLPNGFYSLDTMLCEGVFRALLGAARAEGAARVDPVALGRVLGLDRAPEVKTIRRKIRALAEAGKAGDWLAAMARRRQSRKLVEVVQQKHPIADDLLTKHQDRLREQRRDTTTTTTTRKTPPGAGPTAHIQNTRTPHKESVSGR